jgi:hypothetical protein
LGGHVEVPLDHAVLVDFVVRIRIASSFLHVLVQAEVARMLQVLPLRRDKQVVDLFVNGTGSSVEFSKLRNRVSPIVLD